MRKCSQCGCDCKYSLCRVCERSLKSDMPATPRFDQLSVRAVGGFVESSGRSVRGQLGS